MAQKIRKYTLLSGPQTATLPAASTPSVSDDVVTLGYLQANYSGLTEWSNSVDDITALKAVAAVDRTDQQVRAVESQRGLWQFESGSSATGDDYFVATPAAGTGRWLSLWNRFKDFSASFWLLLKVDSGLTADRTLTVDVNDADRTIDLAGNLTVSGNATVSGTSSGTNTGDQTITLVGDVGGTGTGLFSTTIGANAVTNAKLATMATQTIKGRTTAGTGNAEDLTATQATAILNDFTGDSGSGGIKGLVPAPLSGDAAAGKFLKADGTWAVSGGGGGGGGGSGIFWNNSDGGPIQTVEFNANVFKFEDGAGQFLYGEIRVPTSYVAGSQIRLRINHYHQASSATQLINALTTLVTAGTAFDSTTNQYTSTNTAQTAADKIIVSAIIDLTGASGEINSIAVQPGNILRVRLGRGTDTSTSDISVIQSSMEVTFT